MAVASMTVGFRPHFRPGPALGRSPVPLGSLVLSAIVHATVIAGVIAAAMAWRAAQPKIYVVNLVPAVAAVGVPQGREVQAKPTRIEPPKPKPKVVEPPKPTVVEPPKPKVVQVPKPEPVEAPKPEPVEAAVPKELPPPAPAPQMPTRAAREMTPLPERVLPPRPPALPKPGEKELPTVASAPPLPKPAPKPAPRVEPAPARAPEPAAPPIGKPTGSTQGAGALTLSVGDFPFTWYLQQIQARVSQRWAPPVGARDGQRAVVVFEIGRNGDTRGISLESPSGDPVYDLAALRAVTEASPFPPLPDEFREPLLRVHLGFNLATERG